MRKSILYLLFLILFFSVVRSQTKGNMHLFDVSYSASIGNAEVSQKTDYINRIGVGYSYRCNKMTVGLQYHFLFGNYIGPDLFAALRTSEGLLIASDGSLSDVSVFYRGNSAYACIGRALDLNSSNFIGFNFCVGLLQSNLAVKSLGGTLPFLSSETIKGYDQFSLGPSFKQELRLTHLGEKKRLNFYVELFAEEAFLQNMRKYNYFNNSVDAATHFDFLFGIQAGWVIPVYVKNQEEEFYID